MMAEPIIATMSYIENMPEPTDPPPISRTEPNDPPFLWDDMAEIVSWHVKDGEVDTDWIWDVAAVNGLMPSRAETPEGTVPAELMLLIAEGEEMAKL